MFYTVRYQTGEVSEIIAEMKKGGIPCMDVDDANEFEWFVGRLALNGIYRVEGLPYDKEARNRINEPDFEFRVPFSEKKLKGEEAKSEKLMYIDFFFEPVKEETYDSVGEM